MTTTLSTRDQEIVPGISKRRQGPDQRRAQSRDEAGATSEGFLTDDLALATVLGMQGYDTSNLVRRRQDSRLAEWYFERDNHLDEIVREYRSGSHSVEPGRFIKKLHSVRRQLYTFLDH